MTQEISISPFQAKHGTTMKVHLQKGSNEALSDWVALWLCDFEDIQQPTSNNHSSLHSTSHFPVKMFPSTP